MLEGKDTDEVIVCYSNVAYLKYSFTREFTLEKYIHKSYN